MREDRPVDNDGLKFMEVPKDFWLARSDTLAGVGDDRYRLKSYMAKWKDAIKKGHGVFIAGPRFSGKSYMAAILCKLFYAKWITPQWAFLPDMIDNIVKGIYWDNDEKELYHDRYKNCDVLVMDGLGKEAPNFYNKSSNIIDYRLSHKKITIITSSLSATEFKEKYIDLLGVLERRFVFIPLRKSVGENVNVLY